MLVALEPTLTDKADYLNICFGRHPHRNPWQGRRKESTYRPERTRKRIPVTVGWRGHRSERCAGVGLLRWRGFEVTVSGLYRMGFDPCEAGRHYHGRADDTMFRAQTGQRFNAQNGSTPSDIAAEADRLLATDVFVVHLPLWWFARPPRNSEIPQFWVGRVFVYGKIYKGQMRGDTRQITWPLLFPFNAGTDFDARKRPPPPTPGHILHSCRIRKSGSGNIKGTRRDHCRARDHRRLHPPEQTLSPDCPVTVLWVSRNLPVICPQIPCG